MENVEEIICLPIPFHEETELRSKQKQQLQRLILIKRKRLR